MERSEMGNLFGKSKKRFFGTLRTTGKEELKRY